MAGILASLIAAHRSGAVALADTIADCFARIRAHDDPALFITLRDQQEVIEEARRLAAITVPDLPLYGVPFAVKDNIDVAGLPTTAACPAFAYTPARDAIAVARLKAAGAICIGKTNMDQFATGLVGTRSPYGVPRNAMRPDLIPGGSSSGSAVAVAAGLVPFALGTDTAGSGRVPAGFNNIVGLKPSQGMVPSVGVVPACRSLDCVSIFALMTDDAFAVLQTIAGFEREDPFARDLPLRPIEDRPHRFRVGVPDPSGRDFKGDRHSEAAYDDALKRLAELGGELTPLDFTPFFETARLLYEGPWLAERTAAVGDFIDSHPGEIHPVTREVIQGGRKPSAVDAFNGMCRLAALRRQAAASLSTVDFLAVPTFPAVYTVDEVLAEPFRLNAELGAYTNFVNLLDLCGLAVPASIRPDGAPFGVTLLAPAGEDPLLASIGRTFHCASGVSLGATGQPHPPLQPVAHSGKPGEIPVAVFGAYLSGMPLNAQLQDLRGTFVRAVKTAPNYRLFLLDGTQPPRPGMLQVPENEGAEIEAEIWSLPAANFGVFVAQVPPPLSIGTIRLSDGTSCKGFLVEAEGVRHARDITEYGHWRAFIAAELS